ncbi:hypothetical protein BST81_21505 [Leptolyngbya sp. 'hensonii']|nr:hypothetical protein BST81_21505 [Leptolyngbya sp. 'hensonii']
MLGSFFRLAHRVHNFSHYSFGQDYILEPAYGESGFLMTSQGDDIKPGDLVILSNGSACTQYQVKEIEYYFDSCDIWTALLNPVNS